MSAKRVLISVVGGTVLVFGVALLVLPGPAFLVIPLGLAILATEFVWARRWLKRAKNMTNKRKAKRTTRAMRQAFERRFAHWRNALPGWLAWLRSSAAPKPQRAPRRAPLPPMTSGNPETAELRPRPPSEP